MYPKFKMLNNDRGSILVVALLLLVFLTIIGISATNNTSMELNVTRNSQIYKRDFYVADSGWRAAAMNLQNFGLAFPNYPGGIKAPGTPDGTLNNIDYDYQIQHIEPANPEDARAPGNSGAMGCWNAFFDVDSRALNTDGSRTQEVSARLVKLCCGSY